MTPWRVRDFHADDLDAAVRLRDNPAASSEAPAFSLSDLIAAVRSREPAVVAVAGEELAGTAVAAVSGDRAWVMRISLAAAWRRRGIGSAMLGELERRLVAAGVHRIRCLLGGSEIGALALLSVKPAADATCCQPSRGGAAPPFWAVSAELTVRLPAIRIWVI